jgi:hypothetical protein
MMWHRGTEQGLALAEGYRSEIVRRVADGRVGYRDERCRVLFWSMAQEPAFHPYLQERYGAVFVGSPYAAMPATYARTVGDDPLEALAGRQIFLFDMRSPTWMLNEARRHHVDAIIGVEDPSRYPSQFALASAAAGLPYLAVPRLADDPEVRGQLDAFFAGLPVKADRLPATRVQ